ncbi:TRAP transporter small permease [Hydrogenophaga sp. PAMC20947]|uniref:TRAP transporter small permease n=1 Tax=Hydrogenophaga sp. PAMC20947 TaxID=2565558 RepID=UPI00109DD15C|nr:TRAP transporter small permease [Hydrogenophaga sp. PAMC20947]QCB46114.1 TRAP transporter small permease [Hydrogenophaga sp. PAMC20947]
MIDLIYRSARWAAWIGGVVLVALMLMVVASVTGRALIGIGLGPVPGDFELVEVGVGIAIFFFMPWCYLRGGHATVDLLYMHTPKWAQNAIDLVSDLLMLGVWLIMTWMLFQGMLEKKEYTETTFILQMPVWWAYALCLVGAVMGCLAYLAKTLTRLGLASEPAGWSIETNAGH